MTCYTWLIPVEAKKKKKSRLAVTTTVILAVFQVPYEAAALLYTPFKEAGVGRS